jgi:hypothetical protein
VLCVMQLEHTNLKILDLSDKQKIDDTLIVSETSLAYIPRNKFQVNSWYIFDEFMSYAVDVFATTIANLLKNRYLRIMEKEIKEFKPLGIPISRNFDYLMQLSKKPSKEFIVGWLEEKIFQQFKFSNINKLNTIIYEVLNEIFEENHNLTNPGKVFILEIIKNQKINLYEFDHKKSWITNSVTIRYNQNFVNQIKPRLYKIEDFSLNEIELTILKKIISSQLNKFQNLD